MNKLLIAVAAAGTIGIAALATTSAEAKGFGGHGGGHGFHGGGHHGGGFGHHGGGFRHFGGGYRHYGHRWGGVRVVSYGGGYGGSCWRTRWTPYGYKYVNVCVRPLYY